jgi:serine/threonine protein kinase
MAPHAGDRLGGYQLVELLGAGGMGEVWLDRDEALARRVAVKLLPDELTRDPVRVSRFEQEARAASALNHPSVCTIHGLGLTAEGQRFIAMEHVEGQTLRQRLTTTRLSIRAALDIAIQVASALSAAHSATATTNAIRRSPRWQPGGLLMGPGRGSDEYLRGADWSG